MVINELSLPVWLFKALQEDTAPLGKSVHYAIHKILKEHYAQHNPNNNK